MLLNQRRRPCRFPSAGSPRGRGAPSVRPAAFPCSGTRAAAHRLRNQPNGAGAHPRGPGVAPRRRHGAQPRTQHAGARPAGSRRQRLCPRPRGFMRRPPSTARGPWRRRCRRRQRGAASLAQAHAVDLMEGPSTTKPAPAVARHRRPGRGGGDPPHGNHHHRRADELGAVEGTQLCTSPTPTATSSRTCSTSSTTCW